VGFFVGVNGCQDTTNVRIFGIPGGYIEGTVGVAQADQGSAYRRVTALLTPKIVNFFTKFSDQRERVVLFRAVARIGWRPCRPAFFQTLPS
jgi:hypothetical protein